MIRALGVEWLRLRQRRAAALLAALALALCLGALGIAIANASPPSAGARAVAQAQVDQQLAEPSFQQQLAECRKVVAAGGSEQWPAGMDCAKDMTPKLEWFLNWSPPDLVRDFGSDLLAVTMILALAAALVGITFAGADWSAGTMGTQLLFQPRRRLVFTSKGGALMLAAAVIGLIGAVLAWAVSYWAAARWGSTAMVEQGGYRAPNPTAVTVADLIGRAARAVAAVAGAALGGYALAMLFRSSLVAVSIIAGYGLVVETLARGLTPGAEQYLLSSRLLAWLQGPYEIVDYSRSCAQAPANRWSPPSALPPAASTWPCSWPPHLPWPEQPSHAATSPDPGQPLHRTSEPCRPPRPDTRTITPAANRRRPRSEDQRCVDARRSASYAG